MAFRRVVHRFQFLHLSVTHNACARTHSHDVTYANTYTSNGTSANPFIHPSIHSFIHSFIHTYMHAKRTYIHIRHTCIHACICRCICTRLNTNTCKQIDTYMHAACMCVGVVHATRRDDFFSLFPLASVDWPSVRGPNVLET